MMDPARVIVTGGRDYDNPDVVRSELSVLDEGTIIVHGGARGADTLAAQIAGEMGFVVEEHKADWKRHGKGAGPIRNQKMLDLGADLVIAFPGGRGTADMVRRARWAGVAVRSIPCIPDRDT